MTKSFDDLPFSDTSKKVEPVAEKTSKTAYSSDFESFWSKYPAKVAKALAAKSFKKALKSASVDEIMSGLANYCNSRKVAEGIICNPSTWLNQERWNDECEEAESSNSYALSDDQIAEIYANEEKICRDSLIKGLSK